MEIQSYIDAGMIVSSQSEIQNAMESIGYYRLRGYSYHLYDKDTKQYKQGTTFSNIMNLYRFDKELSSILFTMITSIEVALRVRLTESLLTYNDALVLNDPSVFEDKPLYWKNMSSISSEIARSNDMFIKHHFDNYDGEIPIWAAVEIMSFGTLSKLIRNLKTGKDSAYSKIAAYYKFKSSKGKYVKPNKGMFTSWVHTVAIMRNICAHNSRIYNRGIKVLPTILSADAVNPPPRFNGLYQVLLAMKYIRPSDTEWNEFVEKLKTLLSKYISVVELKRINFPSDWESHLTL